MTESRELPVTNLLITDLGSHNYRLTFGNQRRYVAIIASGSQLDRWTVEIRTAIGAPPARSHPYTDRRYPPGSSSRRG